MVGRRIALLTQGSRGDVEPFLVLALALQGRGHDVAMAAPDDFADWITGAGVLFTPNGTEMRRLLDRPEVRKALSGNPLAYLRAWRDIALPIFEASLDAAWKLGRDADLIVHHPKVIGAADVAEATGARSICASPVPVVPTRAFPAIIFSLNLGGVLNRLSWAPLGLGRKVFAKPVRAWRQDVLGLPGRWRPRPGTDRWFGADKRLIAVSRHVLERPTDWDPETKLTGYWRAGVVPGFAPPKALADFLAHGPPPIYIGFGSMPVDEPGRTGADIIKAVTGAGCRAVVSSGWAGIEANAAPETIISVGDVPHDWLFQHVSAVVHHGGAGTTAAGLTAGKPSFVCPVGVDQPFWGARVAALGAGPAPLPVRQLSAQTLKARLIDLVSNPRYAQSAGALGQHLRAEDGIANALDEIEACLAQPRPRR
ncbi:MAG: glycosyltransferase [Pseudomonadota bacterium]